MIDESHEGLWWHPRMPGQGFDVYVRGNEVIAYWFTRGEKATPYKPVPPRSWYLLSGTGMLTVSEFPGGAEQRIMGTAHFRVDGPRKLTLIYRTDEHGRGAVELQRLMGRQSPRDGVWFDPEYNGEGFSLRFPERRVAGLWYGHRNGERHWLEVQGEEHDGGYDLKFYRHSPEFLKWGRPTPKPTGTGRLAQNTLTMKGKVFELRRLFG